jgi:CRISPR-associated protein Cas1
MHIVLNSYGASVKKENGLFSIKTASEEQQIHPRDIKSISFNKGAKISSDAVLMAIEYEIDILFMDKLGNPKGRVWSVKYGSISDIRRAQLDFLYSPAAVDWVKEMVSEKINQQIAILLTLDLEGLDAAVEGKVRNAINKLGDYKNKARKIEGEGVSDIAPSLRGWEGAASKRYFEAINMHLPEEYRFEKRSRMPAKDMFNALLNYGYGILYGKVEGALIKAGIDPYVGIFHRDDYNRPALAFDVIERYRIWIDHIVIQLCKQDAMIEECFRIEEGGAFFLDGLGKRILIQSVNDYLAEIIKLNGLERSRGEHINIAAQKLARFFLKQNKH